MRFLEESVKSLNEELNKKETIIRQGLMNLKTSGRTTQDMDFAKAKNASTFGSLFKSGPSITEEVYSKMESVLQETILKNIQLQNDIKTLGDEIEQLTSQLKLEKEKS